jgi:hypothetical protein
VGWLFGVTDYDNSATASYTINFGQKPFKFPPPAGFQPLNAANVKPETVITRPNQYVGVTTYTGNGGTKSISVGHKPDFVWIKNRDAAVSHYLHDTVRGSYAYMNSNGTGSENTATTADWFSSFDSNGFTVKYTSTGYGNSAGWNENSTDYVAWSWKAGGSKNTFNVDDVGYASAAASGLTAGDASEVTGSSVGTKQGFSIISYTSAASDTGSAQIPHGLSQTPDFVIIKNRDWAAGSQGWPVWHSAVPNQSRYLDSTNAWDATEFSYFFNNTAPTSTVVNVSSNDSVSSANKYRSYGGSDKFIMYCWHDVPGLQKFGKYSGSGNNDGTFVELGFRPTLVWVKSDSTDGQEWIVYDSKRTPNNAINKYLMIESNNGDSTGREIDFLSNGFKFRNGSSGATDFSGRTYIYAAWAESPVSNLYGAQSNAR